MLILILGLFQIRNLPSLLLLVCNKGTTSGAETTGNEAGGATGLEILAIASVEIMESLL